MVAAPKDTDQDGKPTVTANPLNITDEQAKDLMAQVTALADAK